ncbi:hypothetical protein ACEWY4_021427 [Coilia grayii]|uniref:Uncharacterized protein n=1 Tax=Coilia grayii TaxID=363190 RepID=A0ABD1J9C7_9TELE
MEVSPPRRFGRSRVRLQQRLAKCILLCCAAGEKETAEIATQTEWETVEVATQAAPLTVEAGTQAACETAEAGIQAGRETAEVDTQSDWTDAILLRIRMASGMTQTVQNTRQTLGFEQSTWFRNGLRRVEVRLKCVEKLQDSYKRQWWQLTNHFYVETAEGDLYQHAVANMVTYIKWYCGGITKVSSHLEAEGRMCLEINGVLMEETVKINKGKVIKADGTVSSTEHTETVRVPVVFPPAPPPGFGPSDAAGADADQGPDAESAPAAAPGSAAEPAPAAAADAPGPDSAGCGPESVSGSEAGPGPDSTAATASCATSSTQASGDSSLLPEAAQLPSIYNLFQSTGLEDFSLRVNGLREAFAVLVARDDTANFITVAGSMMLRTLAALNGKDTGVFQQAFDQLVAFAQSPTCTINTELLEVGVHSFNLLDVVFEMVFFGALEGSHVRLVPREPGGFLDHLETVIQAFLPSEAWPPQAVRCWELLRAGMVAFLVEILSLDLRVYQHPQDLAELVFSSLEQRVEQLLSMMPAP